MCLPCTKSTVCIYIYRLGHSQASLGHPLCSRRNHRPNLGNHPSDVPPLALAHDGEIHLDPRRVNDGAATLEGFGQGADGDAGADARLHTVLDVFGPFLFHHVFRKIF